ncbi:hypothetical protein OA501_01405 [Flavobacteriaceae bacterium]|nr:hypothetical protein [Flavobacteriaceae bacterium]
MKEIIKKNTKNLAIWTVSWVGSLAFLSIDEIRDRQTLITVAFAINFAIGIAMIIANKNLFDQYDELQKKIQLEALALTLGLAVVVGISYEASFDIGIINSEPETEYLIMFIGISYLISVIINSRRYK